MPRSDTKTLLALFAIAPLSAGAAMAQAPEPVVVELFTSQSCYSCPPAEALLGELAARPGLIALEWHVDYWNDIVYGSAGQWIDPFSSSEATARQVAYNQLIRGTGNVYTPQMVVDGGTEVVGSRRGDVEAALRAALPDSATVAIASDGATAIAEVEGVSDEPLEVWLVRFRDRETTDVVRGENRGKQLQNHHVVIGIELLGSWSGGASRFEFAGSAAGEGCAILLQEEGQGAIRAAALCPDTPAS